MTAALYYHPEAYSITSGKLMGRHSAGDSFLEAYLKYSRDENLAIYCESEDYKEQFLFRKEAINKNKKITFLDRTSQSKIKDIGCIYYPGPSLNELARKRSLVSNDAWSLIGVTHTTSSAAVMDSITGYLTDPIQPWDALICTSKAVKQHVKHLLALEQEYLKKRFGTHSFVTPKLPIIPLGLHTERFNFSLGQRQQSRQHLGICEQTIVVLYVGRLSFHAKAHPLAMYQALEKASQKTGKKVLLLECGWYANDYIKEAFTKARTQASPTVGYIYLDGRDVKQRNFAWSSADIFCSLADNIQETFGLAPLEAMAAGLPVVASDWNGYRDTIREGVDGFLIKTIMPSSGYGRDLAHRYGLGIDSYDRYCGYTSTFISVDVQEVCSAFEKLFSSYDLRQSMGRSARQRARERYDWSVVFPQYEHLWEELSVIRDANKSAKNQQLFNVWPARDDPYRAFSAYPTLQFSSTNRLSLVDKTVEESLIRLKLYRELEMVKYADSVLVTEPELVQLVKFVGLDHQPIEAQYLLKNFSPQRRAACVRSLIWLCKLNILHCQ